MKKSTYIQTACFLSFLLANLFWSCGSNDGDFDNEEETPALPTVPNDLPIYPTSYNDCLQGSRLNYDNFGEAFMLNYCTMCHSSQLAESERSGATVGTDFDTHEGVLTWRIEIISVIGGEKPTMPPSLHVPKQDKSDVLEWLKCGAPGGRDRAE